MGGERHRARLAELAANAPIRRSDQHPVHQRHHRRAQRRDADPSQHSQQRLLHRRGAAPHRARPRLHSGAALSLLRHGAGQSGLHHPRRGDGLSRPKASIRCSTLETVEAERCTALYGVPTMFIAELGIPISPLRSVVAAHRDHGRLALPDRGDEALRRRDAHARGDDRLRHDRDQPGELRRPRTTIRSSGASAPSAACIRTSRSRSSMPTAASCRRVRRRIMHARLFGDAGLLGRRRTHGGGDRPRRLDAYRRSRDARRGRLLQHRRPHQGHGDPRRRERLSARGRGVSVSPSEDRGRAGRRRARMRNTAKNCAPG